MPAGTKRIMRKLRIDEISWVDRPAQQPALATILKRNENAPEEVETTSKNDTVDILTSATDGHQHGIRVSVDECGVYTYVAFATGTDGVAHDHVIVIADDGTVTLSENHGHTHEIDQEAFRRLIMRQTLHKDEGEAEGKDGEANTDLAAEKVEQVDGGSATVTVDEGNTDVTKEEIAALEARANRAESVAALKADVREYFDALSVEDQDAFLAKSADDQGADIAKAAEATAVVYTDRQGREYTKADPARLVELAKENDANAEAAEKSAADAAEAELTKRAESLDFLPGDVDARKALLKSIDAIEDEGQRDAALSALKSKNVAAKSATETLGSAAGGEVTKSTEIGEGETVAKADAEAKLDEMAKAYQAENAGTSYAKAYDEVLKTQNGAALYAATL